jgi:hypothetical protein
MLNMRDALMKVTRALPNGGANVTSGSIDLGQGTNGEFVTPTEFLLSAPAMATGVMGDGKTMKYDILMSDSSDLSGPTTLIVSAITQTGAGGAGCAAADYRFRLPSNVKRYIGVKATGSTTGDATGSSCTLEALF